MKPIILRAPEVRAALDTGVVEIVRACKNPVRCPYGQPGGRLLVKEKFRFYTLPTIGAEGVIYAADEKWHHCVTYHKDTVYRSPTTMPRYASRLTLEITDVRVIQLQDVSNEDALRAGVRIPDCGNSEFDGLGDWEPRDGFADMWDSRAKAGERWEDNPWVWAITARRVQG